MLEFKIWQRALALMVQLLFQRHAPTLQSVVSPREIHDGPSANNTDRADPESERTYRRYPLACGVGEKWPLALKMYGSLARHLTDVGDHGEKRPP
jgi:hypothetical protein